MLIVAKGNPLSQTLIDRTAQKCVSLNNLHTAFLRYRSIHLGEETKWSKLSCLRLGDNMTPRLEPPTSSGQSGAEFLVLYLFCIQDITSLDQ